MKKTALACLATVFLAACGTEGNGGSGSSLGNGNSNGGGATGVPTSGGVSNPQAEDGATEPEQPDPSQPAEDQYFYFSYDDSSSTASRDLSIFALANGNKPDSHWGRPYEFLNAEQFDHFAAQQLGPFDISFGAYLSEQGELSLAAEEDQAFALGVNISGPAMTLEQRPNVVLTLLVDVSGSMDSSYANETRSDIRSLLDVAKHGLQQLPQSLKPGDVLNLVTFSTEAAVAVEGWQQGQSGWNTLVDGLQLDASTNLNAGIELAYQVANRQYDADKSNRVVILTDAYANSGEVDPALISRHTVINGLEGIYFAGVGIGAGFNDVFLNELTEAGKGVYSAMITPTDAERIFTDGFMRFIDSAVEDVVFKLEYPAALQHLVSAAEQVSEDVNDIQPVDFAFNSQQFFFELFAPQEGYDEQQSITLEIQYRDDQDEIQTERMTVDIATLLQRGESQIKSAAAVSTLAFLINEQTRCDDVLASGLYQQNLESEVFTHYKQHIERFCGL